MLLSVYLREYLLTRQTCVKYRKALMIAVDGFGRFLGRPATTDDLNDRTVNSYILDVDDRAGSRWTTKGTRARLLALWRAAFEDEVVAFPPRRVRKVIVPDTVVDGWDEAELQRLLAACDALKGRFKNRWRIYRRDFARALVLFSLDTGARLGDIEKFTTADITVDGSVWWVQNKTGKQHGALLWPETIEAVKKIVHPSRKTIFGGVLNRRYFYRWVKMLIQDAGLSGTFRFIRRSSGSLVERDNPGWGHKQLGNLPGTFRRHYAVQRITDSLASRPRAPRISQIGSAAG